MSRWAILVVALCACVDTDTPGAPNNPPQLVDTSSLLFDWACDGHGCVPRATPGGPALPSCEPGESAFYTFTASRFFTVVAACGSSTRWYTYGLWGRAVVCESDADCPQLYEFRSEYDYECHHGLCQNIERDDESALALSDAYTLCYGRFARDETLALFMPASQQVSGWITSACGTGQCSPPLPVGCVQP